MVWYFKMFRFILKFESGWHAQNKRLYNIECHLLGRHLTGLVTSIMMARCMFFDNTQEAPAMSFLFPLYFLSLLLKNCASHY